MLERGPATPTGSRPLSVCIVAPEAYPVLAGLDEGSSGGAELQQALLAKALARRGNRVSFVAGDYGQPARHLVDGVDCIRSYRVGHGNRKARFVGDSLKVWRAMRAADADIYFQRCVFHQTGRAWLFARLLGKKFVFAAGHDQNAWPAGELRSLPGIYRLSYARAIRSADLVLCQTEVQRQAFSENYGVEAHVVPNMIDTASFESMAGTDAGRRPVVIWVGTFVARKQPLRFIELAKAISEAEFWVVGRSADPELEHEVRAVAGEVENVRVVGFVPRKDLPGILSGASVLVSTSSEEGFPNVFLEAMSAGVPIVSLEVNPDGLLDASGGGVACLGSEARMNEAVAGFVRDRDSAESAGRRGRRFVREHHGISRVIPLYEALLEALVGRY